MRDVETNRVVDATWLRNHLSDPTVVVVEVRRAPDAGAEPSAIPGAHAVHWKDLLWHRSRREFVSPRALVERLHAWGVRADTTVVFAGDPTQFAAYAIWVATAVGVGGDLRYLDGGVPAWIDGESPTPAPATPTGAPHPISAQLPLGAPRLDELVVGRTEVLAAIDTSTTILDLRSPEEFAGLRVSPATEPIDHGAERAGHIPGALSLPVQDLLDSRGLLLPVNEIRDRVKSAGVDLGRPTIAYCRLSHRAALGWLILTDLLGGRDVRVYDGSWTEWGSLVGAPISEPAR